MLVSVCIPTYNGARYLRETIQSVLSQSHEELEVVIADHGSTDQTLSIVRSFGDKRIRLVTRQRDGDIAANWTAAVNSSSGEFIKVMGQDDLLYPSALEVELRALLSQHREVGFCYSRRDVIDPLGSIIIRNKKLDDRVKRIRSESLLRSIVRSGSNPIGEPVAVMFRREAWNSIKTFRGTYLIDLNFYFDLLKNNDAVATGVCSAAFRVHSASWGSMLSKNQLAILRLYSEIRQFDSNAVRVPDYMIGAMKAALKTPLRIVIQNTLGRR